jgi:hypothetical protein
MASSPEEQETLVEDLFVIGYSGRKEKHISKISKNPDVQKTNELYCQLVTDLYVASPGAARLIGYVFFYEFTVCKHLILIILSVTI